MSDRELIEATEIYRKLYPGIHSVIFTATQNTLTIAEQNDDFRRWNQTEYLEHYPERKESIVFAVKQSFPEMRRKIENLRLDKELGDMAFITRATMLVAFKDVIGETLAEIAVAAYEIYEEQLPRNSERKR